MVLSPSTVEEAVQMMPIIATVSKLWGGPLIISTILGANALATPDGIDPSSHINISAPASDSRKVEVTETIKIKNGNKDRIDKKAK